MLKEKLIESGIEYTTLPDYKINSPVYQNEKFGRTIPRLQDFGKSSMVILVENSYTFIRDISPVILDFPKNYFYYLSSMRLIEIYLNQHNKFKNLDEITKINHLILQIVDQELPNKLLPLLIVQTYESRLNRGKHTTIITSKLKDDLTKHYQGIDIVTKMTNSIPKLSLVKEI
jgi:hypothetical protein